MKQLLLNFFLLIIFSACGIFPATTPNDPDNIGDTSGIPALAPANFDFDEQIILALGGVPSGWEQIKIENLSNNDQVLPIVTPTDLVQVHAYEDNGTSITYQILPKRAGIGLLTFSINGQLQNRQIKIVIPPQEMIQILIGEARSIIPMEITTDSFGRVLKTSQSPTAQAIFAVIRNRIKLIEIYDAPYLFVVDSSFATADLAMRYKMIIEAHHNSIYQFSPVASFDPSYPAYSEAALRSNITKLSRQQTYDQALITAAGIFDETLADNTGGAFGYYSPTETQFNNLLSGLGDINLPTNIGTSDTQFPAFAPLQIRIINEVSPQNFDASLPAFVFVAARQEDEPAVKYYPQ